MPDHQRSFDDMGVPLHDATFVVVDVETTGGSPVDCALTEIGAVKLRGGDLRLRDRGAFVAWDREGVS